MASFKGHLKGGVVFAAAAVGMIIGQNDPLSVEVIGNMGIAAGSVMLGSLLPDIDHPSSFLGRRLKILSKPIYKVFGHRTLTHSIFFIGVGTWLLYMNVHKIMALGLCGGMISHILLDLLSRGSGVAFLYPLYPRRIYLNIGVYWKRFYKKQKLGLRRFLRKCLGDKKKRRRS